MCPWGYGVLSLGSGLLGAFDGSPLRCELPLLLHHGAPNAMVEHSEAFVTTQAGTRGKQRRTHMTQSFLEYDRYKLEEHLVLPMKCRKDSIP